MFNKPLYLNRTSLDIVSWPEEQAMVFHQGELLQGQVKSVNTDGLVLLALRGRVIEATAQVPVQAGQNLALMVDRVEAGRIRLKILNPGGIQQLDDRTIAMRLLEIGVSPQEKEIQMARWLMNYNLPVNRHNMDMMLKSTALLGQATPENMNLSAFHLARDLPRHQAVLNALAQYASHGDDINTLIKDVLRLASVDYPNQESFLQTSRINHQIQAKESDYPKAELEKQPTLTNSQVNQVGEKSGLAVKNAADSTPLQSTGVYRQILDLVHKELQAWRLEISDKATAILPGLETLVRSQPELLRGLLLVQDLLNRPVFDGYHPETILLDKLQTLSREIMGQQISNIITPISMEDTPQCYFSFPVQIGEERYLCEVRVSGEPGQSGLKEQQNINLAVSLNTPALGTVLFHVTWSRPITIEVRSVVESQASYDILKLYLPQLWQSLQDLGYTVKPHDTKICSPRQPAQSMKIIPQPTAKPGQNWRTTVDLKV